MLITKLIIVQPVCDIVILHTINFVSISAIYIIFQFGPPFFVCVFLCIFLKFSLYVVCVFGILCKKY